ncbi:uncharacterized protein SCHCODRAFT_02638973 [Schizophyllum commune H4-8]|uniref:Expressed protein n=1 Tax=Schizophyllum commune (strain H4-8 / FGSC 9210) TaxID=578458 RepID=D8QFW0_SCHCM|nr:uncharacterized protein SCHCODRAFT_02638973 [Schizophyllum commune H4-8]KAI5887809.1 hypothetical protein SCHCODRAFT_02638973 [Schizophyllum commune H4-8]
MAASIASESLPSARSWQNWRPPLTPHVFGFLLTDEVAQKYCAHYCPLSDEDDLASHLSYLQVEGLQAILGDKYDLQNFTSVLVYKDRKRMTMAFALVLADNRGIDDDQRVPPPPEVVAQIADELGLEGAEREPRWYKPV